MIIKRLAFAIALAAVIVALAAGLRYAAGTGILGAEGARRIMQVVIGLALAAYANLMPKTLGRPRRSPLAEARTQAALRVGGWSMTLAGLAYAALWALAPLPLADIAATSAVAAATALTLGYASWAFATCRGARDAPAGN